MLKKQVSDKFQAKLTSAIQAVKIIPDNLEKYRAEDEPLALEYYNEGFPTPSAFQQELKLWEQYWANENKKTKVSVPNHSAISEKYLLMQ